MSMFCLATIYVTVLAKMGHPAKISDMPFLVPFNSAEFCPYYDIFVLFMRQSAEPQWPAANIQTPGKFRI